MPNTVDVLVIGARVAGSVLASRLGDAGARVLLVDSARFPSPTLSTHFFRGAGLVGTLRHLGLLERVLDLGAPKLTRQFVYVGNPEALERPPQEPGDIGYALSVRREALDAILVERAASSPNVEFREATRLKELLWEGGRVVGARLLAPSAEADEEVRAAVTVGADGRNSSVARQVGTRAEVEDPPTRAIFYAYVAGFEPPEAGAGVGGVHDAPEFSLRGDELAYTFPSEAGATCLALSLSQASFAEVRGRQEEGFWEILGGHEGLQDRVAEATRLGPVLGVGPQPNYVRVPAGPGWAMVGDAALHLDPWSGYGMDFAAVHAGFLSESLLAFLSGASDESSAAALYREQRNEHAIPRYRYTVDLASDLWQLATMGAD
ncbi:MAG: NAD(P)/FAD-dependent oxidoreductase [Trueperaceae bacterium]